MTSDLLPLKKTQRIWAIWKSGQNCIGERSPTLDPSDGAYACLKFSVLKG